MGTDDVLPLSRRAREEARRKRRTKIAALSVAFALAGGSAGAAALWYTGRDAGRADSADADAPPVGAGISDITGLPEFADVDPAAPPRALSHDAPLRLWVGGDSLAGSLGPALGTIAGATGVVETQVDYRVSSGLASRVRNWPERAAEQLAEHDPEAIVFIVGANDASLVNRQDRDEDGVYDWEPGYREKVADMMDLFTGGELHRTVFWVGAPTMRTEWRDRGVVELNRVMHEEAQKRGPDVVFVDGYRIFGDSDGHYTQSLPTADGDIVRVRVDDGVHFTPAGAEHLASIVFALLDARWDIVTQADSDNPIGYDISRGSGGGAVPGIPTSTTTPTATSTTVPDDGSTTTSAATTSTTVPDESTTTTSGETTSTSTPESTTTEPATTTTEGPGGH